MYMLRAIMDGNYSFSSPEWNDVSDSPNDLVSDVSCGHWISDVSESVRDIVRDVSISIRNFHL